MDKVQKDTDVLAQVVAGFRSQGKTVVLAPGAFDLLHVGHIRYLTDARSRGDYLIVAIQGDAAVRRTKGALRPVQPAAERAEILAEIQGIHYVVFFEEDDPSAIVRKLKPHVVVRGSDYAEMAPPEAAAAAEIGAKVVIAGDPKPRSVQQILERAAKAPAAKSAPAKPETAPSKKAMKPAAPRKRAQAPARAGH